MEVSYAKKFKGSPTEYAKLHYEVRQQFPQPPNCAFCLENTEALDLANLSQNYLEDVSDWTYLCRPCHRKYDSPKYKRINEVWFKICTRCKESKSEEDFYKRGGYGGKLKKTIKAVGVKKSSVRTYNRIGYTELCKQCTREKLGYNILYPRRIKC
jgi:hypothetical protein